MFHPYLCFFHSTWPGLFPNWTHPLPAQNPTLRRKSSSLPRPLHPSTLDNVFRFCATLILPLSLCTSVFPLLEGYFPRSSHGYGHSGLRLNGTFSNKTSQLRMPLSSIVPCYFPQSPCHSMNFILTLLPFLPLKCNFN